MRRSDKPAWEARPWLKLPICLRRFSCSSSSKASGLRLSTPETNRERKPLNRFAMRLNMEPPAKTARKGRACTKNKGTRPQCKGCVGLGSLLVGCFTVAVAASAARGPFDAKAREIFEKVISIPTSLGNRKVPEMAEYLAGEFRAAGFPAEDITIVPFKLPD